MNVPLRRRVGGLSLLLGLLLALSGCTRTIDVIAALEPVDVVTGWFDAGVVEGGKNKLVPTVSLKLRNRSSEPVQRVYVQAVFRRVGEMEMWGEHFGWAIREPLAPGGTTEALVMHSNLGYTGDGVGRVQMLQHSQFLDAKVEVYLRQGSQTLTKLAEYPVQRQLLRP